MEAEVDPEDSIFKLRSWSKEALSISVCRNCNEIYLRKVWKI